MNRNPVLNNFTAENSRTRNFADINDKKKAKNDVTKEGVVVNTFIKDPDTYYADSRVRETALPKDMFDKKEKITNKWYNHPLVPIIAAPLTLLGIGAGLAKAYKSSFIHKFKIPAKDQIPNFGRIVTINDDNKMVLLLLVQDPSIKSLLATTAVFATSASGFIMKNVVDGVKEVLVKKQFADIKRDKEEKLIDIETRSFSGKNQIIRSLMSQKSAELNSYDNSSINSEKPSFAQLKNKIAFKGDENKEIKKDSLGKIALYSALSVVTIGLSVLFTKSILKNIGSIAKHLENIKTEAGEKLSKDLANLPEKKIKETLQKSKISQETKHFVMKEWQKSNGKDSVFQAAPEMMGGIPGKTSFSSVVSDVTSFIYTYVLNPTPQTRNLALLLCSSAALGYVGEKTVEGIKETRVEKANAKTEVDLQDRLVQVELKNFYQKKNSYIQPLMDDYKEKIKTPFSKEDVKKMKENVLTEIKSGPPFVYS